MPQALGKVSRLEPGAAFLPHTWLGLGGAFKGATGGNSMSSNMAGRREIEAAEGKRRKLLP